MSRSIDPVTREVFRNLLAAIAEEMGVALERTAFSPNIKERRDHSCAVFDRDGLLVAQAAHIPVHLGAFPLMMREIVPRFRWRRGDVVLCNDPFTGGTHLPDISVISPVFTRAGRLAGFVANRAHHADVGGAYPGSMAPTTELYQEGVIIPPVKLFEAGKKNEAVEQLILRNVRTPAERRGDFAAQLAANETGIRRFADLLDRYGPAEVRRQILAARRQTEVAVRSLLRDFPSGTFGFEDALDDDGHDSGPVPICVAISVDRGRLVFDFTGTAPQQRGSINATLAVTSSAAYYALVCLLGRDVPLNAGALSAVEVRAPEGSVVNARPPAAVAAGNVETSQRTVDVIFGALAQAYPHRIPAASQGTMNNLTLGGTHPETDQPWAYYETIGGGTGGSPQGRGIAGVHCHMSNTRNTPAEALEYHYPLRVTRYAVREGSCGAGQHPGGEGVVRELELLGEARATLLTERRISTPYGLQGGGGGSSGKNELIRDGEPRQLPAKGSFRLQPGDHLRISTPSGGGWGSTQPPGDLAT